MSERKQLNAQHYQQAVRFAEQFTTPEKEDFLQETVARHHFEQAQPLQKYGEMSPLRLLAGGGLALIFFVCSVIYWQSGRYQAVEQGIASFAQFQQQRAEQDRTSLNEDYILNLQHRLRENPNDGDLWFELAQAYSLNNEFEAAMICYQNAQVVLGRTAAILGGMATVEYYRQRHQITPQIRGWIDEALRQDSHESASLLLLASDAFLRNEFNEAIGYWEKVLASEHAAIDRREVIRSIQAAKARLPHF